VVEIARALSRDASILVLDEPTSALTAREAHLLMVTVRRLRGEGLGIVYISHRLEEVLEVANRVTVLRDGRVAGTVAAGEASPESLIRMMVGRTLQDLYGRPAMRPEGAELLRVEGLTSAGRFAGSTSGCGAARSSAWRAS